MLHLFSPALCSQTKVYRMVQRFHIINLALPEETASLRSQ
jgi:hypothetical protein